MRRGSGERRDLTAMEGQGRLVVRRRADHEKAEPQGPLRKPAAAMMQSGRSQAKHRHSTEPGLGVGRILSPQARPAWPARMPGSEADHLCAQPRTNRRTRAQRERCRPMTQSRHASAIEPVSHASLGNNDTAQQSAPRKQEGKRESAFMTPSCGNSSTCLASRLDQNACSRHLTACASSAATPQDATILPS